MFQDTPAWRAHVRTNAHLAIRHDAWRFMPPGSPRYVGKDVVRYFWPDAGKEKPAHANEPKESLHPLDLAAVLAAERKFIRDLRYELSKLKYELAYRRILHPLKYGYNPNQPRVPAGNREGGQWTSGDAGAGTRTGVRIASIGKTIVQLLRAALRLRLSPPAGRGIC